MGWSCTVTCRSAKAQAEMLTFLEEHYIPSSRVLPWPKDHWRYQHPKLPSQYTKYAETKTSIGFDSPNDHELAVLRWIALRAGKRRTFKKRLGADFPSVPWVNCDDQDMEPVIAQEQANDNEEVKWYLVDDIGWRPAHRFWLDERRSALASAVKGVGAYVLGLKKEADEKDRLIRADIERLDALWRSRVAT